MQEFKFRPRIELPVSAQACGVLEWTLFLIYDKKSRARCKFMSISWPQGNGLVQKLQRNSHLQRDRAGRLAYWGRCSRTLGKRTHLEEFTSGGWREDIELLRATGIGDLRTSAGFSPRTALRESHKKVPLWVRRGDSSHCKVDIKCHQDPLHR